MEASQQTGTLIVGEMRNVTKSVELKTFCSWMCQLTRECCRVYCVCVEKQIAVKKKGEEERGKVWLRVSDTEMESSSRSTEVIMRRSLAKPQLRGTQRTTDPAAPVKNEPVHESNAKCERSKADLRAKAGSARGCGCKTQHVGSEGKHIRRCTSGLII